MVTVVTVLMILGALAALALPFTLPEDTSAALEERRERLKELTYRKQLVLAAIKDSQLECAAGKLSEEDLREINAHYEREAVHLMERIDRLSATLALDEDGEVELEFAMDELDDEGEHIASTPGSAEPPIPTSGTESACPACGGVNTVEARFCAHCGARIMKDDEE